jgi:tRNA(fMet)-specific endonuclease VapC
MVGDRYQQMLLEAPSLSKRRLQKDMRIAAIALVNGATRNKRDFSLVSGLQLENWAEERKRCCCRRFHKFGRGK